jgi:hypothetical protein
VTPEELGKVVDLAEQVEEDSKSQRQTRAPNYY